MNPKKILLLASFTFSLIIIIALPQQSQAVNTVIDGIYLDTNNDLTVDTVILTVDEQVLSCNYSNPYAFNWANNGYPLLLSITGVSCTGTDNFITLTVSATPAETGSYGSPAIHIFNNNNIVLISGNKTAQYSIPLRDGVAPLIKNFRYNDVDLDGQIDYLSLNFSEDVNGSQTRVTPGDFIFSNVGDFTGSVIGTSTTDFVLSNVTQHSFFLAQESTVVDTRENSGLIQITLQNNLTLIDTAGNSRTITAPQTYSSFIDNARPKITSLSYEDNNHNGRIDQVTLGFSEQLSNNSFLSANDLIFSNVGNFTGINFGTNTTDLITTSNISSLTIPLAQEATVVDTHEDSGTLAFRSANSFNLIDTNTNQYNSRENQTLATIVDGTAPIVLSINTIDYNRPGYTMGKLDHLEIEFSEPLADITSGPGINFTPADFDINNVNDEAIEVELGVCPHDQSATDQYLCVAFSEETLPCDISSTAGCDTNRVNHAISWTTASLIADTAGNNSAFSTGAVTISDGAQPIPIGATILDVGTNGSTHNGLIDHAELMFSEPINEPIITGYQQFTNYNNPSAPFTTTANNTMVEANLGICPNDNSETDNFLCIIFDEGNNGSGICNDSDFSGCDTGTTNIGLNYGNTASIHDMAGNQITRSLNYYNNFTLVDGANPIVVFANPSPSALAISPDQIITVYFSEPMGSVTTTSISFTPAAGSIVGILSNSQTLTITHNQDFDGGISYTLNLSGAQDLNNLPLVAGVMPTSWNLNIAVQRNSSRLRQIWQNSLPISPTNTKNTTTTVPTNTVSNINNHINNSVSKNLQTCEETHASSTLFCETAPLAALVRTPGSTVIYYSDLKGKRHSFINQAIFDSWYAKQTQKAKEISETLLATLQLSYPITFKPGSLIKIATDPKVYLVTKNRALRHIFNEQVAEKLMGSNWNHQINTLDITQFSLYQFGYSIIDANEIDLVALCPENITIENELQKNT